MFLKKVSLQNFRNYSKLDFEFKSNITILLGNNAQGKTNFLESVFFLATSKSKKADKDEELIKQGEDFLRVEGLLENDVTLEIAMQNIEGSITKRVKVNGVPRRINDYRVNLAVIEFTPEDINLVTGSPSERRYHIDQVLSQVDKEYKKTLSSYENLLIRKNKVLKAIQEGSASLNELTFWSDQQVLLGNLLSLKREEFFNFLNTHEKKFGKFIYQYLPNIVSAEKLKEYKDREIASANSLIGPHRDDFIFFLESLELSKYGSRAQQRTSVLDLKLSEVEFIENILGDRPLLLLDDIFSELDFSHREHVLELANLQQTIITTVELDETLKDKLKDAAILFVENGQILKTAHK